MNTSGCQCFSLTPGLEQPIHVAFFYIKGVKRSTEKKPRNPVKPFTMSRCHDRCKKGYVELDVCPNELDVLALTHLLCTLCTAYNILWPTSVSERFIRSVLELLWRVWRPNAIRSQTLNLERPKNSWLCQERQVHVRPSMSVHVCPNTGQQ